MEGWDDQSAGLQAASGAASEQPENLVADPKDERDSSLSLEDRVVQLEQHVAKYEQVIEHLMKYIGLEHGDVRLGG